MPPPDRRAESTRVNTEPEAVGRNISMITPEEHRRRKDVSVDVTFVIAAEEGERKSA